jgi:hypothetical protein
MEPKAIAVVSDTGLLGLRRSGRMGYDTELLLALEAAWTWS